LPKFQAYDGQRVSRGVVSEDLSSAIIADVGKEMRKPSDEFGCAKSMTVLLRVRGSMSAAHKYYENRRSEMLRFIPEQRGRALEIGCGIGSFIGSLPGVQETWGIEPSAAAAVAESRLTKVLQGTFDETKQNLPKHYFDVVICNDVIEHMTNHVAFLGEIGQYIAPNGTLVGSIPNVRFYDNLFKMLFDKDWKYTSDGILDRTHMAFFTKKSLRETLERTGFELINLEGINIDYLVDDTRKSLNYRLLARWLSRATFGYYYDIRFLQFAFQAKPL
jgi:2-polyprenyl-3-methyl-5-hydroxy-6-metoxy-1,4-benzoquinol methylase